ncbi:DUF2237 family protein [Vibrio astriarenae]
MKEGINVYGDPLSPCSCTPMTGYFRDGYCKTDVNDFGRHVICAEVTEAFLEYTKNQGNDLSTPLPEYGFKGLSPGDRWCLCAQRWKEAWEAGCAPLVVLSSCEESSLDIVPMEVLELYAVTTTY